MEIMRRIRMLEANRLLEELLNEAFNPEAFLDKARSVMMLARRGATEGERQAGKLGMQRLMARGREEIEKMREEGKTLRPEQRKALHDRVDRFLTSLQQIQADDNPEQPKTTTPPPPPPKDKAMPHFKVGQWVVHIDDGSVGKIMEIKRSRLGSTESILYEVRMADGLEDLMREQHLRAATQEDIDAAVSQRPTKPLFADGDYVISTDDNRMARISVGGVGWDRQTKTRWYEVDFLNGDHDLLQEKHLRRATHEEIQSHVKPKTGGSNSAKSTNEILSFARYINPAENSNKVYGVVKRNGKYFTFWGGFKKALATKQFADQDAASQQYDSKTHSGYRPMNPSDETSAWIDEALNARFAKLGETARYWFETRRYRLANALKTGAQRRRI
jgi:hypothetical protein